MHDTYEDEDDWIHLAIAVANVKRWLELTKQQHEEARPDRGCGSADQDSSRANGCDVDQSLKKGKAL